MKQAQVENVSILIHFMDGLSDPKFDMDKFRHDCDTPACALGWATTIPALRARGLMSLSELCNCPSTRLTSNVDLIMSTFGDGTMTSLFSSFLRHEIKTPKQWADHARAYLKKHGHVPADDGFKAFMAKAMQAVAMERA